MITPNAEARALEPYKAPSGTAHTRAAQTLTSEPQQHLRQAAMAADANATSDVNLSILWRELARGSSRVLDGFFSEERCYLVVARTADGTVKPIENRRLEILEAVLSGLRQKNIAIDMQLAPSTVALNSRLALASLGVSCKPSRAHPLLMLAAKAVSEPTLTVARCSTLVTRDDRELRVISAPRPDQRLSTILPCAELAVIRWLVEGHSYVEIAQRRGTSTRTIANQITAVFRRLRISGRNELVQHLFVEHALISPLSKRNAETLAPPELRVKRPVVRLEGARRSA
jgi:DNA-binding NarL/FixJ family response regulator